MIKKGLGEVVATETDLSRVDGQNGNLLYRGYDIRDLVDHATYEEVVYLLWYGNLPDYDELEAFRWRLAREREISRSMFRFLESCPDTSNPMDVIRTAVSLLGIHDPAGTSADMESRKRRARIVVAQLPTIIAAFHRLRNGLEPIPSNAELPHTENFLHMLTGEKIDKIHASALDRYFILLADHGFNASTFSARVTASTLSDFYSTISSAIGTLKGPLHGGAPKRVMEMLLAIERTEDVEEWVDDALSKGERIFGFGHRVYKTRDPRGVVLDELCSEVSHPEHGGHWYNVARKVEEVVMKKPKFVEKKLYPNVDFYTAPLLYMLGIPVDLFSTIFAAARVAGWSAHVLEQYENNRLIRPLAKYVGPVGLSYIPIDERRYLKTGNNG